MGDVCGVVVEAASRGVVPCVRVIPVVVVVVGDWGLGIRVLYVVNPLCVWFYSAYSPRVPRGGCSGVYMEVYGVMYGECPARRVRQLGWI